MRLRAKKRHISREDSSSIEFDPPHLALAEIPFQKIRAWGMLSFFTIICITLLGNILYLQVVEGSQIQREYEAIHLQREWILPPRGLIRDHNKVTLAVNGPGKEKNEFSRIYPQGPAFSHLLGFIGRVEAYHLSRDASYIPLDFVGKMGIEATYEQFLRGEHGSIEKPIRVEEEIARTPLITAAKPGNNLTLTVDSEMQKALYKTLIEQVEKFDSPGAAGIIMDPENGAVRALVSIPSFDNNAITTKTLTDPGRPLFNRTIAGEYPSGSTIKPFLATAALEEGIITPQTIILDRGSIEVSSIYDPRITWTFRGWKALGRVDLTRAIAMSSNIYFYIIGGGYKDIEGLGIEKINTYLERFGWNQRTGIDIQGETSGLLPTPKWKEEVIGEEWFIGDTYNTSIGQGFLRITPLQLALATSALANGGSIYEPYLVEQITDQEGNEISRHIRKIMRSEIVSHATLQKVREGMREAVTSGTVWRLNALPVAVAAKTGTAQAGGNRPHHGWVTIFAPYENPEIILTILIENGEGGEQSAVPAAKEFLQWYFQEYQKPSNNN